MKPKSAFATWLERQFLNWQAKRGARSSIEEFAKWLGLTRGAAVQWLNDQRRPNAKNVHILAQRLGLEVYDVLGLPRPDPLLFRLRVKWDILDQCERETIGRLLEKAEHREAGSLEKG